MIRLLLEMLERGIDINITVKLAPTADPVRDVVLKCPYCEWVTVGHKSNRAAERALRSHKNHCANNPEYADLVSFIEEMDATKKDES